MKKIISIMAATIVALSCVTSSFAASKKEVEVTDLQTSVMFSPDNGASVYLNVVPPIGCIAEYADGDYTENDEGVHWMRECPKYSDFAEHDVTVKVSGDEYYDTLFCFTVKSDDLKNIVSAKYDKLFKKLTLTSNDPLLSRAYVIHAMYDTKGVLNEVKTYDVSFTNQEAQLSDVNFDNGKLYIWKAFDGAGAMFPLCEKISLN